MVCSFTLLTIKQPEDRTSFEALSKKILKKERKKEKKMAISL